MRNTGLHKAAWTNVHTGLFITAQTRHPPEKEWPDQAAYPCNGMLLRKKGGKSLVLVTWPGLNISTFHGRSQSKEKVPRDPVD